MLIDVNGRLYGSVRLAVAAGANLPAAAARLAVDARLPDVPDGRSGVCFVWTEGEVRRRLAARRNGSRQPEAPTPPCATRVHGVWSPRDPGPAVAQAVRLGGRAARRVLARR